MVEQVAPATVDELAAVLREPAAGAVVARGGGTKQTWGGPLRQCELLVDLHRLDRVLEHAAGDLVVRVQAGVPLAGLAELLARAGQQLAIDIPSYDDGTELGAGTVGGALAVGLAGPRRLRYGTPRDLLLGVTMVRADGVVATAGGRVVKNVAGYDLGKLLCGSYGTLAVIAEAVLRLHPLPAARQWVTGQGVELVRLLAASQTLPSAVEIDRPGPGQPVTVAAMFEGTRTGVAQRVRAAAELIGGEVSDQPPEWFGRLPGSPSGTLVDLAFPPAVLAEALAAVPGPVRGSAAVAALQAGLPAGGDLAGLLSRLRDGLGRLGGVAVVRHAPAAVRAAVDVWGPVPPGTAGLLRRVKEQFDPGNRLAPGRFAAGI